MRLSNKAAIVTGGGGWICSAISRKLASEGARVVVADFDASTATLVADEITASGGIALARHVDVTDPESVAAMTRACVDAYGSVDILLNGAGTLIKELFIDTPMTKTGHVAIASTSGLMFELKPRTLAD